MPGSALRAVVTIAALLTPVAVQAQCPSFLNNDARYTRWPDAFVTSYAFEHVLAAGEANKHGDAHCAVVLEDAATGLMNTRGEGCGVWWVDPTYLRAGDVGAMPSDIGAPDDTLALILINGQLEPLNGGGERHMAVDNDSVGTTEAVTHEALHASFNPRYFGRGISDIDWQALESTSRSDAAMCAPYVHFPAVLGSSPEQAGFRGVTLAVVLAAVLAAIAGGWGISGHRWRPAGQTSRRWKV